MATESEEKTVTFFVSKRQWQRAVLFSSKHIVPLCLLCWIRNCTTLQRIILVVSNTISTYQIWRQWLSNGGVWVYDGLHLACSVFHCLTLSRAKRSSFTTNPRHVELWRHHVLQMRQMLGLSWALSSSAACSTSGCCRASSLKLRSSGCSASKHRHIVKQIEFLVFFLYFYLGKET